MGCGIFTASDEGAAVLIHNMTEGTFCGVKIKKLDNVDELLAVQDDLAGIDGAIDDFTAVLDQLSETQQEILVGRTARSVDVGGPAAAIARNAGRNVGITRLLNDRSESFANRVLSSPFFDDPDINLTKVQEDLSLGEGLGSFPVERERFFGELLDRRDRSVTQNPFEGALNDSLDNAAQADAWELGTAQTLEFKRIDQGSRNTFGKRSPRILAQGR